PARLRAGRRLSAIMVSRGVCTMSELDDLEASARSELTACGDEPSLRAWHTRYFGKEGAVPAALKKIVDVPADQRRAFGQEANRVKQSLTEAYETALTKKKEENLARSLAAEALDVTLPGRTVARGRLHVAT